MILSTVTYLINQAEVQWEKVSRLKLDFFSQIQTQKRVWGYFVLTDVN